MTFKLINTKPDALHERQAAFTKAFLYGDGHLELLGRIYGKLLDTAASLDTPIAPIVAERREALRGTLAFSQLCAGDRECIEWIIDKAVAGGQPPARLRPAMAKPVLVTTRFCEAINALCVALSDAVPDGRCHLDHAVQLQLACEPDFLRMCGEGQSAIVDCLDENFDPVPEVERERRRS